MIKEKVKNHYDQMFGEPVDQMVKAKPEFITNLMYAVMILSDAQEIIKSNRERARQFINKAKYFIALEMDSKADKGVNIE